MVFHHLSKRRTAMSSAEGDPGADVGSVLSLKSPLPARRGSGISSAGSCPGSGMKKYQKSSCSAYSLYSKNS